MVDFLNNTADILGGVLLCLFCLAMIITFLWIFIGGWFRSASDRLAASLSSEKKDLEERKAKLEKCEKELDERKGKLDKREEKIAELEYHKKDIVLTYDHLQEIKQQLSDSLTPVFGASTIYHLTDALSTPRFVRGMDGRFTFASEWKITADIQSGDKIYHTSLTGCNCPAQEKPCKHMLWLAAHLGFLQMNRSKQTFILEKIRTEQAASDKAQKEAKANIEKMAKLERRVNDKVNIIEEKQLDYPWMVSVLAEYDARIADIRIEHMNANRAYVAQEHVKEIKKEKRLLLEENLLLKNQRIVYEYLFPWLSDVRDANISPDDAARLAQYTSQSEDYTMFLRRVLTLEEFVTLTPKEKFSRALEYCRKNKPPQK